MTTYLVSSAAFLLFLAVIWNRSGLFNVILKIVLFGLGAWASFLALLAFGFVFKK